MPGSARPRTPPRRWSSAPTPSSSTAGRRSSKTARRWRACSHGSVWKGVTRSSSETASPSSGPGTTMSSSATATDSSLRGPLPVGDPAGGGVAGLDEKKLYLITAARPDLEDFLEAAIRGGVDIVQLRDKQLGDEELLPVLERARDVTRRLD